MPPRLFLTSLLAGLALLTCRPVEAATCPAAGQDIVCTTTGAVRGTPDGETLAFKGIPYAAPPVGTLRWRPPQPAASWDGVRPGDKYGLMCPQMVSGTLQGDEDCLYLNVWRPTAAAAKPLPVMVWLTGGGNFSLSGKGSPNFAGVVYNGRALVPQGVIYVSYNLRLGALGFLAHPAFDAERPEHVSGNYGSLDQVAMLRWIRDNIAGFGGDPSRVMLFGTSAGGGNICALMTSPQTRGLISAVAMQSSVPSGCEITTLSQAESLTGARVTKALACDGVSDIAACLRSKTPQQIVAALPGSFTVLPRDFGPVVDGWLFPEQPLALIKSGVAPALPVIIGNTSAETRGWADTAGAVTDQASYNAAIDRVFGAGSRERILGVYPASHYATPRAAFAQVTTDAEFTCQSRRVAQAFAGRSGASVYRYLFEHEAENDAAQKTAGAVHTAEHPFFFAWQGRYRPTPAELALQQAMLGYWTRLADRGDPNAAGSPAWLAATPDRDAYLLIGDGVTSRIAAAKDAHCDFWDMIPLPSPHL